MSEKLQKEFEKEMKMKSTISYGGPEIIGRFEGQYTLWLESALLREREEKAMSERIPEMSEELLHKAMVLLTISLGNRDEDWQTDYNKLYDQYWDYCGERPESKLEKARRLRTHVLNVDFYAGVPGKNFNCSPHKVHDVFDLYESAISEMFTGEELRRAIDWADGEGNLSDTMIEEFIDKLKAEKKHE
jgi:hypothetical protein